VYSTSIARVDTAVYIEASLPLALGIQRGVADDTLGEVGPCRTQGQPPGLDTVSTASLYPDALAIASLVEVGTSAMTCNGIFVHVTPK
jgi:hypothetical protein